MEKIKGIIYRKDAIDALDEIESEVADGDGFQYEKWKKHFCELPSARQDHIADDSKMGKLISRQDVVECVYKALRTPPLKGVFTDTMSLAIRMVNDLPFAQIDWGKPVGDGRPLADGEVIPRLQTIKAQIGGSYAIERAIEVLEQLPTAHPDSCDGCEWEYAFGYGECHHCKRAYNDMYEVKDEG